MSDVPQRTTREQVIARALDRAFFDGDEPELLQGVAADVEAAVVEWERQSVPSEAEVARATDWLLLAPNMGWNWPRDRARVWVTNLLIAARGESSKTQTARNE